MITLANPFFWVHFGYFFIAVFIAFYIPGAVLLSKLKLTMFQKVVIGLITGMVLWGLQGFLFGYLHIRFVTYVYLIVACALWLKMTPMRKPLHGFKLHFDKADLLIFFIIMTGVIMQLTSVWPVGLTYANGVYFCCSSTKDNIYQIALTNQLVKNVPPFEPGMGGVVVHNYHYLGNLVVAELVRVFQLPLIAAQYQYFTLFISLMLGLSVLVFGQVNTLQKRYSMWLLFFMYFGADLIYLIVFINRKVLNFSMSSIEDGSRFLHNPPRAFAVVVLFIVLSLFTLWVRKRNMRYGWIMAVLAGSLIAFKVYIGFFALSGFIPLILYFFFTKQYKMLPPLVTSFIISLLLYLPVNSGAGGLYYTGFWVFENFIVQPMLALDRLELARQTYASHRSILRVAEYEGIFAIIYFIGVFGTKLIGLIQSKNSLSKLPKELHILLLSGVAFSLPLGLFFQQTSGGSNSFNFIVSIFLIGSIYTALTCYHFLPKLKLSIQILLIALIVTLTLPRIISTTSIYFRAIATEDGFVIPTGELEAYTFLREHTPDTSLVAVNPPEFHLDYDEGPYISFLADRPEFLAGTGVLNDHAVDITKRKRDLSDIFQNSDCVKVKRIVSADKINYLLMHTGTNLACLNTQTFLTPVYTKSMKLLKVTN